MKLIGYCRVSTTGQEDNTSLEVQEARLRMYCELLSHTLVSVHKEIASAKDANRPLLRLALRQLKDADGLIITKLDRLSRNLRSTLDLYHAHFDRKQLVIIDLNVDTSTPTGRAIFSIIGSVAQLEREQLRERCLSGIRHRLDNNGWVGGIPPYGTRLKGGKLVPHPEERYVLRLIRAFRTRRVSYRAIAKYLNSRGYRTRTGGPWLGTSIRTMLHRRFGDGHTVETFDPAESAYRKLRATV